MANNLAPVTSNRTCSALVPNSFQDFMTMAEQFSKSNIVPQAFRGNTGDCLIAMDMAVRMEMPPMAVFQNIYVVHGKPAFSGSFYVACINKSGRYTPIEYDEKRDGDKLTGCRVRVRQKSSGREIFGPWITMEMATKEGWVKNNPKWTTMPDLMLRYRAASFFARTYCPDVVMGIPVEGEVEDIPIEEVKASVRIISNLSSLEKIIFDAKDESALDAVAVMIKNDQTLSDDERVSLRMSWKHKKDSLKKQNAQEK